MRRTISRERHTLRRRGVFDPSVEIHTPHEDFFRLAGSYASARVSSRAQDHACRASPRSPRLSRLRAIDASEKQRM